MSATTSSQPPTTRRSDTLVHEQIDLGQLSMALAQSQAAAYPDNSSLPENQTPITSDAPAPEHEKSLEKMTIWEIFTSMFQNNETDPVKVTATVVLSRAWSILVIVTLGVFLFLISDGKPSSSRDADNTAPPPAPVAPRPRVKITAWRILNTSVLLVLGTYKAVATYLGETAAPTNLDWMIGVVWALISYWVSIVEQEAPSIAPWFFTTDWSRRVRFGVIVFFLALSGGIYWAVIYGMVTLIFPHPIHWTVAHALLVAIAGLLVQMLIGLGTLALSMAYATQLRRLYNTVRIPPFYDALFRSSDWSWRSMVKICIFTGLFFLSPIGVTVMLTTRPSHNMEFESEVVNMFFLAVVMPCAMLYGIVVIFFGQGAMTMCFRLIRKAYPVIGNLLRKVYRNLRGFDLNTDF